MKVRKNIYTPSKIKKLNGKRGRSRKDNNFSAKRNTEKIRRFLQEQSQTKTFYSYIGSNRKIFGEREMSEELQRYLRKKNGKNYYEGDKLNGFEHYILGSTTLKQLKQAGIINDFLNKIIFKPKLYVGGGQSK